MAATPVVIDACSSLNLFASGHPVEIAKAANLRLLVLPEVQEEASHLFGSPDESGVRPREPIDWDAFIASGVATSQLLPEDALPSLIALASQLTDIDAKCVALAIHLRVGLLSDDGKVRRVFSAATRTGLRSTVSTIRQAAEVLSLDKSSVRAIFGGIRERARFEPPPRDPQYAWYLRQMR